MIVGQVPVCKRCNAQFSALARLNRNVSAAIMFQSEAYVRPRHGVATANISARRIFRPSGAEEFAADGHFSEKLLHTNACYRGKCGRTILHNQNGKAHLLTPDTTAHLVTQPMQG